MTVNTWKRGRVIRIVYVCDGCQSDKETDGKQPDGWVSGPEPRLVERNRARVRLEFDYEDKRHFCGLPCLRKFYAKALENLTLP